MTGKGARATPQSGRLALPGGSWLVEEWHHETPGHAGSVLTAESRHAVVSGAPVRPPGQETHLPKVWAGLSAGAALLAIAGSVMGLLASDSIYGHETSALGNAAAAQDLVNLVLVGPLFLIWVLVLGLSLFALIGGLTALDPSVVTPRFAGKPVRLPGWFLIVVAVLFALLWLSEIVPDLLAGRPSSSATDWKVPTNPVHVLDLTFFLPAACLSGVLLLRHHWLGYGTAAGQLVWLELTCLPILVTPFIANLRGYKPGWSVMAPIGVMGLATLAVLWRVLHTAAAHPAGTDGDWSKAGAVNASGSA